MKSISETCKKWVIIPLLMGLIVMAMAMTGCPAPSETPDEPEGPIRIAFVPSIEQGQIAQQLDDFDAELGELLGHPVESSIVLSYSACIEQMAAGHFEAALLPSLAYVLANDRYGVNVVLKAVRNGSPTYRGQILVRVDSGIDTLEDLRGRTLAFTEAPSASGHLYPKTLLIANGIDPETDLAEYAFVGSHTAVAQAVLQGRFDAGAMYDDARLRLMETETTIMDETKVIAYTPGIPSDTVSLRGDLEGSFWVSFVDAMITMSQKGEGGVLFSIYEIEELMPAEDSDYDPIREMVQTLEYDIEAELDGE